MDGFSLNDEEVIVLFSGPFQEACGLFDIEYSTSLA